KNEICEIHTPELVSTNCRNNIIPFLFLSIRANDTNSHLFYFLFLLFSGNPRTPHEPRTVCYIRCQCMWKASLLYDCCPDEFLCRSENYRPYCQSASDISPPVPIRSYRHPRRSPLRGRQGSDHG